MWCRGKGRRWEGSSDQKRVEDERGKVFGGEFWCGRAGISMDIVGEIKGGLLLFFG